MLKDYIQLGQRVELQPVSRVKVQDNGEKSKVYSSKVYDILSDERMEILMPFEQSKLVLLPVNTEYEVFFYGEHSLYECVARIVDRYKSNNTYILLMELTTNLSKYQRREFYRFSSALDMETRALTEEEIEAVEKNEKYYVPGVPLKQGVIVDISGGGLRFVSSFAYEKGSLIYCTYRLQHKNENKIYEIVGKVLDVRPIEKKAGSFEHRVQYLNIDKTTREEIIQYIFEEERKNRNKKKDS